LRPVHAKVTKLCDLDKTHHPALSHILTHSVQLYQQQIRSSPIKHQRLEMTNVEHHLKKSIQRSIIMTTQYTCQIS
jgi:hypothetical protein